MLVNSLRLSRFRNIREADLSFGPSFNILHGDNGHGKTNVLEGLYLLAMAKSFRGVKNRDLVMWGEREARVFGRTERDRLVRELEVRLEEKGRTATVDGKTVTRASQFYGIVTAVLFAPDEMDMAKGGPEGRRRYADRASFSAWHNHLQWSQRYQRGLRQRNALLKSGSESGLDEWDRQLAEAGSKVIANRLRYLEGITPLLRHFYGEIAGTDEEPDLKYQFSACGGTAEELLETLKRSRREELRRGTTIHGPHRDDIQFSLRGKPLRSHASQGQQRTFILALKMAEIEFLEKVSGTAPILLLDDMSSELDAGRNENLMGFLNRKRMQVFVTTTNPTLLAAQHFPDARFFRVRSGQINPEVAHV